MMWNNDDFSPEAVDEQIERFVQAQSPQHLNAALTQELKAMCEEDQAMLERAWMRYIAQLGIQPSLDAQPNADPAPNAGAFSTLPVRRKERLARRSRWGLPLVAALLVAAVLVGSAQWAVKTLHQPGGATHLTATPQLTQVPTSTLTPAVVTPVPAPSGRDSAQLVYDDATGSLLLFSGMDYTGAAPLTDTWLWTGTAWTQLHPAHHPSARSSAAIAYDPATRQIVLFGGDGKTSVLNDTWTWNGSDWTQQHPTNSPPARVNGTLAYDVASGQLVLFGGKHAFGLNNSALNDTWIWTSSNWVQQHPASVPPARTQAALAYDAASGQLVLFGGRGAGLYVYGPALNDTWIWTGSNWVQQHPTTAPPLTTQFRGQIVEFDLPSMAYNPTTSKLMLTLIGQDGGDGPPLDYWTQADWLWTGNNWIEVNATGPAVQSSQLFYDAHLHTVFDLTSFLARTKVDIENKLWKWTGQTWELVESW